MNAASLLLLVMACGGFTEERFLVDGYGRWCDQSAACSGTFESQSCYDLLRSQDRAGCTYDPEAAEQCFDALETAECFDDPLLDLPVLVVPESCELVYGCGAEG